MMKPQEVSSIHEAADAHGRRRVVRHLRVAADADRVSRRPIVGQVDDGRLSSLPVEVDDAEHSFRNFGGGRTLKPFFSMRRSILSKRKA